MNEQSNSSIGGHANRTLGLTGIITKATYRLAESLRLNRLCLFLVQLFLDGLSTAWPQSKIIFCKTTMALLLLASLTVVDEPWQLGLAGKQARADIVVHDTSSDPAYFANTGIGWSNFGTDIGGDALFNRATGIQFLGNGQAIKEIEIIFQYGDNNGFNSGNPAALDWTLALYLDSSKFTSQGLFRVPGHNTNAPDFFLDLASPTNSDYLNVINTSGGVNNHRAIVDLHSLGITNWQTINGQNHLAFLVPLNLGDAGSTETGIALSSFNYLGNLPSIYHAGGPNMPPPMTLLEAGANWNQAAGRITTAVPEPGSLSLIAIFAGGGFLLTRRRCRDVHSSSRSEYLSPLRT